jgi:hypothetical protein
MSFHGPSRRNHPAAIACRASQPDDASCHHQSPSLSSFPEFRWQSPSGHFQAASHFHSPGKSPPWHSCWIAGDNLASHYTTTRARTSVDTLTFLRHPPRCLPDGRLPAPRARSYTEQLPRGPDTASVPYNRPNRSIPISIRKGLLRFAAASCVTHSVSSRIIGGCYRDRPAH